MRDERRERWYLPKYVYCQRQSYAAGYIGEDLSRLVTVRSEVPVEYVLPREGGEIVELSELNV
jgi:hypothetical protein